MISRFPAFLAAFVLLIAILCRYIDLNMGAKVEQPNWKFTAQRGFFSHDNDPESWEFRATTLPNLGLLKRGYPTDSTFDPKHEKTQWQRFEHYIHDLNKADPQHKQYKVLFLIRHGEGIHNVKEREVGREEWDRHWSKLSGDDSTTWEDAELTDRGKQQAQIISEFWKESDVPDPHAIYSSPLRRCLHTTKIAFGPTEYSITPIVKEKVRERLGLHTCDKRSTREFIASTYPDFEIEPNFTKEDELWKPDVRETFEEHVERKKDLLEEIFEHAGIENVFVSLTAHSGALMALFGATGWKKIPVAAGAVYPLLVLGERES